MGIFGKYRYHEPWESVDNDVAAHYGLPVHSLYVEKHDTVDEMDQVRYHKTAKFMSSRYKTDIYDATEAEPLTVVITSIIQSMYETVTSDCGV